MENAGVQKQLTCQLAIVTEAISIAQKQSIADKKRQSKNLNFKQ